ncbi:MAG: tetratricopeptide repeat protein [Pegethrix bostrychoides GSE-TBD4-15B]|jgi:tetratricopeptide (TPR) repeat protein|uniref:Tetratricopeptide repeat protein n=1 Tax=Pegethrix bostrychoides GSE-TBD4-15B TaxID=2839662 RepID=A0A951U570_9CYAN|nr:tetratricopeptide repeat protein [Pegethrix bostrychoides GSE-TBD4-15B]
MRFFIVLRGYALLLIIVFFIGLAQPNLTPEEMTPTTAKEFLRRGERYAEQGDYEKALADFNQAEQLRPHDRLGIYHSIYHNQAKALTALNHPAEAIQKYQKIKRRQQEDDLSTAYVDGKISELQTQLE